MVGQLRERLIALVTINGSPAQDLIQLNAEFTADVPSVESGKSRAEVNLLLPNRSWRIDPVLPVTVSRKKPHAVRPKLRNTKIAKDGRQTRPGAR